MIRLHGIFILLACSAGCKQNGGTLVSKTTNVCDGKVHCMVAAMEMINSKLSDMPGSITVNLIRLVVQLLECLVVTQ